MPSLFFLDQFHQRVVNTTSVFREIMSAFADPFHYFLLLTLLCPSFCFLWCTVLFLAS